MSIGLTMRMYRTPHVVASVNVGPAEDSNTDDVELAAYISGEKQAPLPTYFIGAFGKGSALAHQAANQTDTGSNVHYLGRSGLKKLHGLNVAYLDGMYDSAAFQMDPPDSGACRHYTKVRHPSLPNHIFC